MSVTKRRLVKLIGDTGLYAEVDLVKLRRLSRELLSYIQINISPHEDEYEIWKWVVPMCTAVLDGTIRLPVPFLDLPLNYPMREGLLPTDFQKIYAAFKIVACGMAVEVLEKVVIDGATYAYADFEE
ncbi:MULTISPECIES: hypothetical protein [Massilia]|uniref:hypothetical protein n=1 Tax=Massilia TaxID=149698 RepID=UPI002796B42C|nr:MULTISPECIES: hypothetical protein [unclassified Massilia]MDQ1832569.1 hypothetical protein [Massilia sp. CCM 9029]MDQ1924119.1 hypothetical protein [Massilia sp. CCM 9206]